MKHLSGKAALLVAAVATGGCSVIEGIVAESIGAPVETKTVASKQGTQELIASDGTFCFVSRGKFQDVQVGDRVQCTWSSEPSRSRPGSGAR